MIDRIKKIKACGLEWNYFDGIYWTNNNIFTSFENIYVPANWKHNGTSYFYTFKKTLRASIIHDYLLYRGFSREICDKEFKRILKKDTNRLVAAIYYLSVRSYSFFVK